MKLTITAEWIPPSSPEAEDGKIRVQTDTDEMKNWWIIARLLGAVKGAVG